MVPKGWEVTRLGACVDLMQSGLSRKLSNEDIGLPVIRSGNMEDVETNFDDLKYWYADDPQGADTSIYVLQDEDILVNFINSLSQIGKACIYRNKINRPCIYTTNLLRIKANGKIDNNYLFCQTKTARYDKYVQSITKPAVNQASFTTKEFKMFEFLLPPLPEQRKIAQILSTWDKAITTTERLLANRQQQKKALMQCLLTGKQRFAGFEGEWCITTLGEVFSKITNGLTYDARATEGLPVTRIETISTGFVNYVKVGWAPANENTKRFRLQYGDILYSHINSLEHIGRVAFYREEYPLYHGMNLLLLRPNDKVIPEFVYYVLNSQIGKRYAKLYAKAAVNQASISTTEIKTFKIKIPNKNEQQKIASVLSAADAEISTIQNQLNNLKQQKKALMQQLLTGKRRVKVDSPALATQ